MTRSRDLSAAAYARAIERNWSELAGRPVILSPRDWSRISDWHARRVPLEIVQEAMEEAAKRARGRTAPLRTLAAVGRAVEEAWQAVQQGRIVGASSAEPRRGVAQRPPRELWTECLTQEAPESGLRSLLQGLLDRLERGDDPFLLDEELDRDLADVVPEALLQRVWQEISRELEEFRSRMSPEQFAASRRRGSVERLRRHFGLPRLSAS